jgi:hypothetical protein
MLYNFMSSWRWGEVLRQRKRRVRTAKASNSRTTGLDERSMSELDEMAYELVSCLKEIAHEFGFTIKTQRDMPD